MTGEVEDRDGQSNPDAHSTLSTVRFALRSIIFDPRSFADGGIHETAALAALETPLKQRLERGMQLEEVDEEGGEEEEYIKNWRERYEKEKREKEEIGNR